MSASRLTYMTMFLLIAVASRKPRECRGNCEECQNRDHNLEGYELVCMINPDLGS